MTDQHIEQYFRQVKTIVGQIDKQQIAALVEALVELRKGGGRLFLLGVGGSAGNGSHAVNEFRKLCALEAYAPMDNVSELSARINDEGWDGALAAKGLLLESMLCEAPAIIIEGRNLYSISDPVPAEPYRVPFERAVVRRSGADVSLIAIGNMVLLALRASESLSKEGIEVEVVDPRTLAPLDRETICTSVAKTGLMVVVDPPWHSFGASAEITASVSETVDQELKANLVSVSLPDSHTPKSIALETQYYPSDLGIADAVRRIMPSGRDNLP